MMGYKTVEQNEKTSDTVVVMAEIPPSPQQEQQQESALEEATPQEVRGAGVGGGLVGLVLGGPILAVIGGIAAAKIAKSNSRAGRFCRTHGKKVARAVVQVCDWLKNKMQPDGDDDDDNDNNNETTREQPVVEGVLVEPPLHEVSVV